MTTRAEWNEEARARSMRDLMAESLPSWVQAEVERRLSLLEAMCLGDMPLDPSAAESRLTDIVMGSHR